MTVSSFALAIWTVELITHCFSNWELLYQYPCDIVTNLEVCRYCWIQIVYSIFEFLQPAPKFYRSKSDLSLFSILILWSIKLVGCK